MAIVPGKAFGQILPLILWPLTEKNPRSATVYMSHPLTATGSKPRCQDSNICHKTKSTGKEKKT